MALHLDVVCDPEMTDRDRREQSVWAIKEILPFVLAKYGISTLAAHDKEEAPGPSSRFNAQ